MWKRKNIKKNAIALIKSGYGRMISVCFLIAMLTTAYAVSTTFLNLQLSSGRPQTDAAYTPSLSNSEVLLDTLREFLEQTPAASVIHGVPADISSLLVDLFSTNLSVFFSLLRAAHLFLDGEFSIMLLFPVLGILILFLYQIFISNILIVGEKRFFLEIRKYPRTPVSKIFCLYKLRCIRRPAWVMLCRSVFQFFWNFTIAGGIIKHYEYILIPYILAENPKACRKDVFCLSKQLMKKNKWKFFLLDLSFLGWKILSVFTLGLLDFLFVNPYLAACRAELYAVLRRNYVLSRSPGYEILNDSYLEHVPSEDELLISKALYDDSQGPYTRISYFEPEQYPVFLFSVQPPLRAVKSPVRAERKYDVLSYLFLFLIFSVFGWLLETLLRLVNDGVYASDTLLHGPWIPVYGAYGVLILLISRHLIRRPVLVFAVNAALYTLVEYLANTASVLTHGSSLRDYSNFLLNLDGRVYLGGSVTFALLGCAFLYYLAPRWADRYMKLGHSRRVFVCVVLYILLIADLVWSVR